MDSKKEELHVYGKFTEKNYYNIWYSAHNSVKKYWVDYFQIEDGQVKHDVNLVGAIEIGDVYESIKQRQLRDGKTFNELPNSDYIEMLDLRDKLKGQHAQQCAQDEEVELIDACGYYELHQENDADYAYGAIEKACYDKQKEELCRKYKVVDESENYDFIAAKERKIKQDKIEQQRKNNDSEMG